MASVTDVRDSGDLWRLTMEHSPVGMALLSTEGVFLTANRALCEMLGHDAEALNTLSFHAVTHPDDLELVVKSVREMLIGEVGSFRMVKRCLRADGSAVVGDVSVALLRGDDGRPLHIIAQVVDLSGRHALEQRLDAAEEEIEAAHVRAEAVFEAVDAGLLLFDAVGNMVALNRRQREIMAMAYPDGHGGTPGQTGFVFTADQSRLLEPEELPSTRAAAGEPFEDAVVWIGAEPRHRRALSVTARPVRDRTGATVGSTVACTDITDLVRATQVKESFVAAVSHELRTPLTAALAYLELVEDSPGLSDDIRLQLGAVRRNSRRLAMLVNDLIYAARATTGTPAVDRYRIDLAALVREALSAAEVDAAGKDVCLVGRMAEEMPVIGDGMQLRHAIDNLIAHAVGSAGDEVRVDATLTDRGRHVVLSVVDDGDGVADRDGAALFGSGLFVEQDTERERLPTAGRGLRIARSIIEAHGGEIHVESTLGVGTTVRVELPC